MSLIPDLGRSALRAFPQDPLYLVKPADLCLRCWRWLNRDEDITLDYPDKIWKQSTIAEIEEPEHELKDKAMTVLQFSEELGLIEPGIKVSEGTDSEK
jgi:hypothetical protein